MLMMMILMTLMTLISLMMPMPMLMRLMAPEGVGMELSPSMGVLQLVQVVPMRQAIEVYFQLVDWNFVLGGD